MDDAPIGTLARGFAVLRAFGAYDETLSTGELVERTGLPPATVSRLAATLTGLGVLARTPRRGHYRLGVKLLTLSHNIQTNLHPPRALHRAALKLSRRFDIETCVSIFDGVAMMPVEIFNPPLRVPTCEFAGDDFPLVTSATGRAYLAGLGAGARQALVERVRASDSSLTDQQIAAMRRAVARFPQDGYCISFQEAGEAWLAVAVPVMGADGWPAYVLTTIGETATVSRKWLLERVAPAVIEAARPLQWRYLLADSSDEPARQAG
jgi:DNA-binding IclR family transcriptional regulator